MTWNSWTIRSPLAMLLFALEKGSARNWLHVDDNFAYRGYLL